MIQQEFIQLTRNNSLRFNLAQGYSYVSIKKIIVDSLFGEVKWVSEMAKRGVGLRFTYSNNINQMSGSFSLNLVTKVEPNFRNPVFDFENLIIPEENYRNSSSFKPFFTDLIIELTSSDSNEMVSIVYELSPGAKLVHTTN